MASVQTPFKDIVGHAVGAFKDDPNLRLLNFFLSEEAESNVNKLVSRETHQFMEAWSSSVVKSQAFVSRKEKNAGLNGTIISDELTRELTSYDEDLSNLNHLYQKLRQNELISDVASMMDMSHLGLELLNDRLEQDIINYSQGDTSSKDTSILRRRQELRGSKRKWSNKHEPPVGLPREFIPVDRATLGFPGILYGTMQLRKKEDDLVAPGVDYAALGAADIVGNEETLNVIGVKVSASQPSSQNYAWQMYSFLQLADAMSHSDEGISLSLFSRPLGVDHAPHSSQDMIYSFESHPSIALSTLLTRYGSKLVAAMRRHPLVLTAWCKQLSLTIRTLQDKEQNIQIVKNLDINDFYIRHDGLLIASSVAILSGADPSHHRTDVDMNRSNTREVHLAADLISTCLGLSRRHTLKMRPLTIGAGTDQLVDDYGHHADRSLEFARSPSHPSTASAEGETDNEIVLTLTVGATMYINICAGSSSEPLSLSLQEESREIQQNTAYISVQSFPDPDVASVSITDSEYDQQPQQQQQNKGVTRKGLMITARSPGDVLIQGNAFVRNVVHTRSIPEIKPLRTKSNKTAAQSTAPSTVKQQSLFQQMTANIRIAVIPAVPIESLPIIEVAARLESAAKDSSNSGSSSHETPLLMNCRCFKGPYKFDRKSEELLAREWAVVRRELRDS